MDTDICNCKATRGDHYDLATRLAAALKSDGSDSIVRDHTVTLSVAACDSFQIDRKATWDAEKANGKPVRTCLRLSGCTTCGARGALTYHKDQHGQLRHTGCPGLQAPKPASTDKSKTEAPR